MLFVSRLLLDPLLGETVPLVFFTLAVVVSAIRGGFGPGIFSTVLGVFFGIYFSRRKARSCLSLGNIWPLLRVNCRFFV
jgi:Domain of unknown function (DUF4118)